MEEEEEVKEERTQTQFGRMCWQLTHSAMLNSSLPVRLPFVGVVLHP